MIEIEFIGTGGQGSVVAGRLLANAAAKAGFKSQAFASYGALRRGGDVESYVRLSEDTIRNHSKIYGANYVIMMDESMIENAQKKGKFRKGATVIINTQETSVAFPELSECNVITIDANRIASRRGVTLPSGMPVINTTVLGTLWALIRSTTLDQLIDSLKEGDISALEKNLEAVKEAYASIKESLKEPGKKKEVAEAVEEEPVKGERLPEYRPKMAHCEANCPAGEQIRKTAFFTQHGHFEEALESIREENPFPGICGRVCFHPCETNCSRIQFNEGIATNALERAAFDYADSNLVRNSKKKNSTGKKVAVIGSGPAGMTCAYYLALLGHGVTVFEAQPVAGGVPRFGIPEYHLPRKIVEGEIKHILDLGVEIKLNTKVGKDIAFDRIVKGFDACFTAVGAHRSAKLGILGEDSNSVLSGLAFLRRVAFGEKVDVGKKVVVIGGGNVAMDVARTARRLGAAEVQVVCLESREEMPAHSWEIEDAEAEGIVIKNPWGPAKINADSGKISSIEFVKCISVFDSKGRFSPRYDTRTGFKIDYDTIITAAGEGLELPFPEGTVKMSGPVIEVDALGRTSAAGVYAGGDAASTSHSVVEAIASGKRAAIGIDLYLSRSDLAKEVPFRKGNSGAVSMGRYMAGDTTGDASEVVPFEKLNMAHFTKKPRVAMKELPVNRRVKDFSETRLGFSKKEAIAEAERCFQCGTCVLCEVCYISCPDMAISINEDGPSFNAQPDVCKSCGICIYECPRNALSWEGAK